MDAKAFDAALASALRLCREAAELRLPVEEMLEHVEDGIEAALTNSLSDCTEAIVMLTVQPPAAVTALEALREIIAAVAEVVAIGENLPPEPKVTAPAEPSFPMPANLRGAT